MSIENDIPVRIMNFNLEKDLLRESIPLLAPALGVSMTLPYLEPYLIRTMKEALKHTTDDAVAKEVKQFIGQEAQHYRQHAVLNDMIRSCFPAYEGLREIEEDMERDYQQFSRQKSLKFNLAYAEGFEAATCVGARIEMRYKHLAKHHSLIDSDLVKLFHWHLTEEIEHRTVTFNIYKHLYGDYVYRLAIGAFGQQHFFKYVFRFARFMDKHYPNKRDKDILRQASGEAKKAFMKELMQTYLPTYDPAKVHLPEDYDQWRNAYTADAVQIRAV